jgi:hypothetical protein
MAWEWVEKLKDKAVDYLTDRYAGDKAVTNIIGDATGAYTAYKSYEDQKRANEALESAYREYTQDKERSQETIDAALALGLSPMTVSGLPTKKSEITDFTEVQDVAKGGIISLPNKKRKKYARGPDIEDIEEMDEEIITPFDLKNEEGVPIGPMVEVEKTLKKMIEQGIIDENTSQDEIKKIVDMIIAKGGPNEFNDEGVPMELEEIPITPHELRMEEGVPIGPMVQQPELVKPPWMTQEEFLNFQYGRNQAARGGIMHLRNGGRPGYADSNIEEFKTMNFERENPYKGSSNIEELETIDFERESPYPTNHKFWELVDWKHEDKKSKEKEDAINADMEAGMSWDDIKKKYNLKDFEDVSIKETEREETDSGNKVKEIFETIKEKVGSIDFSRLSPYKMAQGGRTGYKLGVGPVDPEQPPIYLPDPNEESEDLAYLTGEGTWGIDRAKRIWEILPDDIQDGYKGFQDFFESTDWHGIKMKKGGRVKRDNGGIMDLGGMEKDYRFNGGFVPIGEYEKKDDVPARLSKNEFVMTADAVRAAGGGSINQGAQRMYNIMKNLEAQPTAKRRIA